MLGRDGCIVKDKGLQESTLGAHEDVTDSGIDFRKAWRRKYKTAQSRYGYLRKYNPNQLKRCFKVEIDSALLQEIVEALLSGCDAQQLSDEVPPKDSHPIRGRNVMPAEDEIRVLGLLNALSCSGNFPIASKLIPRSTLVALTAFFEDAASRWEDDDDDWKSMASSVVGNRDDLRKVARLFGINILCS